MRFAAGGGSRDCPTRRIESHHRDVSTFRAGEHCRKGLAPGTSQSLRTDLDLAWPPVFSSGPHPSARTGSELCALGSALPPAERSLLPEDTPQYLFGKDDRESPDADP